MDARDVVIVGGARTAIGKFGGGFKEMPAHKLGAAAIKAALERAGVDVSQVDEVVMGQIGQVGPDAYNARRCAIEAGLPVTSTAMNVNRLCGSGLQAIWSGAQNLKWGASEIVVAGGNENMSMQPFLDYGARDGYKLGDRTLIDGSLSLVSDPLSGYMMGFTAECVADTYDVSRQAQDEFALLSQQRAASAIGAGRFKEQIIAVTVPDGRREVVIDTDEHPRAETTIETLTKLRPVFKKDGSVTAGNSSGINDGGSAVVMMTAGKAQELGLKPLLRLVDITTAGIEPELMGYAPTFAIRRLLERNKLQPSDIDLMELNEAFASQAVAVVRDTAFDIERVNPNGGAIAMGHPVGATGCMLVVKAMYDLQEKKAERAIVSMCIGGGQALAALFENVA